MKKLGIVEGVFSADENSKGLPRPEKNQLNLIEGLGIENDKFSGKDLDKTVMIIGRASYDIASNNGMELKPGSYGENILFDFDPHELSIGDSIVIDDAEIEITERCTICNHLGVFGKELPKLIKEKRGLYCKVVKSGRVSALQEAYLKEK